MEGLFWVVSLFFWRWNLNWLIANGIKQFSLCLFYSYFLFIFYWSSVVDRYCKKYPPDNEPVWLSCLLKGEILCFVVLHFSGFRSYNNRNNLNIPLLLVNVIISLMWLEKKHDILIIIPKMLYWQDLLMV